MSMPVEPPSAPPIAGQDYVLADEYSERRRPNPDPLHVDETLGSGPGGSWTPREMAAWRQGHDVGLYDGAHSRPIWRRIVAAIVATFIAGLLIGRLIVPVSAAPRSAQPVIPSGRPMAGTEVDPAGQIGAPPMSITGPAASSLATDGPVGGAPPSSDVELGTAIESGVIAYAARSFGDRYLALPEGPGSRVTICSSQTRCIVRTSTDAGPSLQRQREGRIADVSFADFAWLCRCDPPSLGTMVATIERGTPGITPPPTSTEP
jgi:hypothetical protein